MKRFLILSILAAFLAIPAISLAGGGGSGAGTVSSIAIQENSVNTAPNPSVMVTDTYKMINGGLAFTVTDGNQNQGSVFKGTLAFGGPQAATNNVNKTLKNLFVNMSGLVISADKTPTSVSGSGAVNGSVTYNDGSGSGDQSETFTGAYSMKVTLSGATTANGGNPTGGTAAVTITISNLADSNGNPMPTVLTMKLPTTSFAILGNGTLTGGVTTGWSLTPVGAPYAPYFLTLTQIGPLVAGTIVQINEGDTYVKVSPISGTIDNSSGNVNLVITDTSTDGSGNTTTTTTTVTGTIAPGTFGTPGATMSGTYTSPDGPGDWNATEGALSTWSMSNKDNTTGKTGTGTVTLETQTSDGSFLGTMTDNKGETGLVQNTVIAPTTSGSAFGMTISMQSYTDDGSTPVINTTTVTGTVKTGTYGVKGATMGGDWHDNFDSDSGNWTAKETK